MARSIATGGFLLAVVAGGAHATAVSSGGTGDPTDPVFDHPPTPTCEEAIVTTLGQHVSFTVQASDATGADLVTLDASGVPGGGTMTPPLPTVGNPVSTTFDWDPTSPGRYSIEFIATDIAGNFVVCTIPIEVGIPPPEAFCFGSVPNGGGNLGDGGALPCPCGNTGAAGNGCANSTHPGGANLSVSGEASLSADTLVLTVTDQHPGFLQLFLQSDSERATPVPFGDGLRCLTGNMERLFRVIGAHSTTVAAPSAGSTPPSPATVSGQSAVRGDPLSLGDRRSYQVYYRDANPTFCPIPIGSTFNVTNAVRIFWGP